MITLAPAGTLQGSTTTATTVTYTLTGIELVGTTDAAAGTPKILAQGQMATTVGALYAAPGGVATLIKEIHLKNTAATLQAISLYVNGTAATNALPGFTIPASGSAVYNGTWTVYDSLGYPQVTALSSIQKGDLSVVGPHPWIDVMAYGADPTGAADSLAAFNAALAAATTPLATVYVPVGNYRFSAGFTVPGFVRLQGAGEYGTRLIPNFTTGDFITLGGGCTLEDFWLIGPQDFTSAGGTLSATPQTITVLYNTLDFPASGTGSICLTNGTWTTISWTGKTAFTFTGCTGSGVFSASALMVARSGGAAVNTGANSLIMISRVRADYMYDGLRAGGVAVTLQDCFMRNNVRYNYLAEIDDGSIYMRGCWCDNDFNQSTAGLEITQGAAVMSDCQLMRCRTGIDIPVAVGGIFSMFVQNCFLDNCLTAAMSITGTNAFQRCKFLQTWFSSSVNGVVINNVAATAVEFQDCDFYLNTANGMLITACSEWSVSFSRFAANTTAGIQVSASSPASDFAVVDCLIGPLANSSTGVNGAGIIINAGTYANIKIVDNNLQGNTGAALTDGSTVTGQKQIADNLGLSVAPLPYVASVTIAAVEAIPAGGQIALPAGSLLVGTTFMVIAHGAITATVPTILPRIRLGTLGTTADTIVCALAATAITTGTGWQVIGYVTIRTIGSGGTAVGNLTLDGTTAARTLQTATVAVNTTVANFLSFTLTGGGTTPVITPANVFWQVVRQ
jgi:pectate lyase-like protein/parallel beta helix pectate lyase-like protein